MVTWRFKLRKLSFAGVVSVLAMAFVLAGCGGGTTETVTKAATTTTQTATVTQTDTVTVAPVAAAPSDGDTLIIGAPDFPPSADQDLVSHPMQWLLTLYTSAWPFEVASALSGEPGSEDLLVPVFGKYEPRNFESWEVSEDGRTFTFHLKQGVISYYGNELTTEDILWSYQRDHANAAIMMFFWSVSGLTTLEESLNIIDKYTFSLTTPDPTPMLLDVLALDPYMREDSTEAKKHATADDPWANEWIRTHGTSGFGPYVIDEWVAGDMVTLKANPNYVNGKPAIDNVIFKVIPESSNRLAALLDGTIHYALNLTPDQIRSLDGQPGVRGIQTWMGMHTWGLMNNTKPPFDNKLVRKAFNHAIDKEAISETAYGGLARPWMSALPEVFPAATTPDEFPYPHDVDAAKALMAQAGYDDGFEVELLYDAANKQWETAATLMKTQLAEIGVTVTLRATPSGAFSTLVGDGDYEFALYNDAPILDDPNYGLTLSYKTDMYVNWVGYSNPEVDALLAEGAKILDKAERYEAHKVIQRIVMDDAPIIFAWNEAFTIGIADNIRGIHVVANNKVKLADMYFVD